MSKKTIKHPLLRKLREQRNFELRKINNNKIIDQAKDTPCHDCGLKFPPYVMEFDHTRGMRGFNISDARGKSKSAGNLRKEIEKCDVVCRNCHAVRTWERRHPNG